MLSEQGGLKPPPAPPALLAHVEHQKTGRVEGAQDRADEEDGKTRGSKSKRLHKEAQSGRKSCCIDDKFQSENSAIRDEDEPGTGRVRTSNTESGALVCCCTCSNSTTQTRPKQCKHEGAKQATRHTKGAETSDKTNFADVLTGSRKAIVQSTSRVKHRLRADEGTTRAARRDESRSRGQGRREV